MRIHRNWAIATFAFFLLMAAWRPHAGHAVRPFFVVLLLYWLRATGLAWRGGEVVYRYGIGVMALPKLDQHDHGADNHDMQENPTMTMTPKPPAHIEDGHAHEEEKHAH